jgi:peptide/nickel transport system substrate-binding protein
MRRRTLLQAAAASAIPTRFAIAQPMREKTLRFVPQANLSLLDPIFTTAQPTVNHGWAIYDLLFGINAKLEPKPQMAEGYTLSDDGRTYTIMLRDGLKFHNGEPVRAQDCAPSLARWAARETIGQTVWQYVDEYKAADDRTLVIKLKRPIGIFIDAIARGGASVAFMMPEHMAKTDPFKQISEHIGSGPYKFLPQEFIAGAAVAYERYKEYVPRQEPAEWSSGGKVAHFERIEWKIIPDTATAAAALQAGEIDWYEHCQADLLPILRKNPDIAFGKANPTGFNGVMRFNHLHLPFNNVKVRKAVMMAVRQEDYMAAVTGGDKSLYQTCKSMFPCGSRYDRNLGAAAMPGDLELAKKALAESGYNGEKVVLLNPTDLVTVGPMGDLTYDIMKRMGMNIEMVATDWGTVAQRRANRDTVDKGGWSVHHTWGPSTIRQTPVEHSQIRGQGAKGWFGWYEDAEMERLTREFVEAATLAERDTVADTIQRRAFDMVPSVPLGTFIIPTAYRRSLTGMIEATGPYMWNIRRV